MTTMTADSPSQDSYWASADLPPPEQLEDLPPDRTELVNPPEHTCPACGEEIVRQEGQRGKLPKYHPDCKPTRGGSTAASGPRPVRVSAKDRLAAEEVEAAIENLQRGLAKLVMYLSLADPYDALVIHINTPDLLNYFRVILMRYPVLRKGASEVSTMAAFLGIIFTVLSIVLPIAVHHGLLPKGKLSALILNAPLMMLRLQERMARVGSNEEIAHELLEQVAEEKRRAEARLRQQATAETVDASTTR